jgi:hypothetical protein
MHVNAHIQIHKYPLWTRLSARRIFLFRDSRYNTVGCVSWTYVTPWKCLSDLMDIIEGESMYSKELEYNIEKCHRYQSNPDEPPN